MACNLSAESRCKTDGRHSSGHTSYHTASSGAGMGPDSQALFQARFHYERDSIEILCRQLLTKQPNNTKEEKSLFHLEVLAGACNSTWSVRPLAP
eukprot:3088553-Amphidinium_carterae.4